MRPTSWLTTLGCGLLGLGCTATSRTGASSDGGANHASSSKMAHSTAQPSSSAPGACSAAPPSSEDPSSAPAQWPTAFTILGIIGLRDSTLDAYFTGDNFPAVAWSHSTGHQEYAVTVLDKSTGAVRCPTVTVAAAAVTYAFTSCRGALRALDVYQAQVVAVDAAGHSLEASNSPYAFTYDPAADAAQCAIAGGGAVVANGAAQATVTISLRNGENVPLEGIIPTFAATNTGATNVYGACLASTSQGVSLCTITSTVAELKTLTLLTPVSLTGGELEFHGGPAAALQWSSASPTVAAAGGCAGPFTVVFKDAFGNTGDTNSQATLTLSQNGAGVGEFFANPGCTGAAAPSIPVLSGATQVSFFLTNNAAGLMTILARLEGAGEVTGQLTVLGGPVNTWALMSQVYAPTRRCNHAVVWMESEMLVWGGRDYHLMLGQDTSVGLDNGAKYSPLLDAWTPVSTTGAPAGTYAGTAVWSPVTGEALVWGGMVDSSHSSSLGGRYNPATHTWLPINPVGAAASRAWHFAFWTGQEMLVWGGMGSGVLPLVGGAKYNPMTDTWAPMSSLNGPSMRQGASAVWTGTEMIIWGGLALDEHALGSGARYNPVLDTWQAVESAHAPAPRYGHGALWNGHEMIIFGGATGYSWNQGVDLYSGGQYDPATGVWTAVSLVGMPSPPWTYGGFFAGTQWTMWAGTAFQYDTVANAWSPSQATAPPADVLGVGPAIWNGAQFLLWGGWDGNSSLNRGLTYTPPP